MDATRQLALQCLLIGVCQTVQADVACEPDDMLARAAAEVLLSGGERDGGVIARSLAGAGSDLVGARALFFPGEGAESVLEASALRPVVGGFLRKFAAQTDAPLVCGEATGERGTLLLAAPRAATLEPLRASRPRVSGSLMDTFDRPELVILEADGRLRRRSITRVALSRGIPLSQDLVLPARIQLVATGRLGPRPVAQRTLALSLEPAADGARVSDPQAPVDGLLNRLRASRGVHVLRRHRLLRGLAAEHAFRVCRTGTVGHTLQPGDDPKARAEAAGLEAQWIGETVARAAGPSAAFASFTRSPSHLLTLLEPAFTDAGVGVARDAEGRACVVVLLARWPHFAGK